MHDRHVRAAVLRAISTEDLDDFKDDQDALVVDELCLCQGEARIDIAVINGKLHGYEIKSEQDTLDRLPRQAEIYNRVLDTVTIVTSDNHLDKARAIIPQWWGIVRAEENGDELALTQIREAEFNQSVEPFSLVQLLWREEALAILEQRNMAVGLRGKARHHIWRALAESLPPGQLSASVRETIRRRTDWRAGSQRR